MAISFAAVILIGGAALYLVEREGRDEAIHYSRESAVLIGRGIIAPLLTDAAIDGDPTALAALDGVVRERVLDENVVRLKVWDADGRIVYSDLPELIGQRYPLDAGDLAALQDLGAEASVSMSESPEHASERGLGKLLDVDVAVDTPAGQRVLVESYTRFTGFAAGGRRVWVSIAPIVTGAVLLLWLALGPLTWLLARQLRRGQVERGRLLVNAVESTDLERRRIAADLHDGVVQRLAGTAYSLAAASERLPTAPRQETRQYLDEAVVGVRTSMRELRSLIVELHPPSLATLGLEAALADLAASLTARDITVEVDVAPGLDAASEVEKLVFRGAQEAVRNVLAHARATSVAIRVTQDESAVRLVVDDNGVGIGAEVRTHRERDGHLGLRLLEELAAQMDGTLTVTARPEGGTRLALEVPEP